MVIPVSEIRLIIKTKRDGTITLGTGIKNKKA
jgi:hypothetical protein